MKKHPKIALALAFAAVLGACDDSPTGDDAGTVSMLLTDAPGDFARAVVTIARIELIGDEDADDGGGGIVLRDEPYTGDLLELSNDVAELVSDVVVPSGEYHQIRFVISGGCIEVETETGSDVYASTGYTECGAADGSLQMPSFDASGLKVTLPSGFRVSGDDKIVLIDFDVAESFGQQAGQSGMWVMHPVIHATEIVTSGSLQVSVMVAESVMLPGTLTADSFSVRVNEEAPITVNAGVATFNFLIPGTYSLQLVAPAGVSVATDPTLPLELQIGSGEDASVDVTITGLL